MDFDPFKTVEKGKDYALAIASLALLILILTKLKIVSPTVASASGIFLGLPVYFRIILNFVENEHGAVNKFKKRHGILALLGIPYILFLIISLPLDPAKILDVTLLLELTLGYFAGFFIIYLTFKYFLLLYNQLKMKEKRYRERVLIMVPATFGISFITLWLIRYLFKIVLLGGGLL